MYRTENRREIVAGATIFMTMAYIIIVNPVILSAAGIPFGAAMVATIVTAGVATLMCGIIAKRPFGMAPYMGENAFFAYSVVLAMSIAWTVALGAVFIAGVLFLIFSLSGWRRSALNAIPPFLTSVWGVSIGLFLLFIGLANAGISVPGIPGAPVDIGDLAQPEIIIVVIGIAVTLFLHLKKVVGSILIGTVVTMALGFIVGGMGYGTVLPSEVPSFFGPIPDWGEVFLQMDISGALAVNMIPIILVLFLMDFMDTTGTILGLSAKAGFLDYEGRLPKNDRTIQVDAASTVLAGAFGTSTTGTFVESATGIEQGGRTGKTAIVAGVLFLAMLALTPFFSSIPTGFLALIAAPALVVVGISMTSPIKNIDFEDMTQAIPAVLTIAFMLFTFNIGFGMSVGLISYPLVMTASGRRKEMSRLTWVLGGLGLLLFAFYPY
ncbi:MAG: NCS2 family permease [Methanomassiliicoccales archaeon]|nr:NCS2 family permease [Methanomassiliicoccales archaeon]